MFRDQAELQIKPQQCLEMRVERMALLESKLGVWVGRVTPRLGPGVNHPWTGERCDSYSVKEEHISLNIHRIRDRASKEDP